MANLITEIYVSVLGDEYIKLDLYKDESVLMKYTTKDLQDISKVFAPYSTNFTFPATEKNVKAFGFFGNTDVIKVNTENKFYCKTYTNGILSNTGFLQLSSLKYKKGKPSDFTGSFTTTMTNLKDRIGEDDLTTLAQAQITWNDGTIHGMLSSSTNVEINNVNVNYFIPLVSNTRVWSLNSARPAGLLDNIAYSSSVSPYSSGVVVSSELRPAISFKSIIDIIRKKYNLDIVIPIETQEEYKDAYIYCNNEEAYSSEYRKMIIKNNFGSRYFYDVVGSESSIPSPKKYDFSSSTVDSSIKIHKNTSANYSCFSEAVTFRVRLDNVSSATLGADNLTVDLQLVEKTTGRVLTTKTADIVGTSLDIEIVLTDAEMNAVDTEFYLYAKFSQPTQWDNMFLSFRFAGISVDTLNAAYYAQKTDINNNILDVGANTLDLFKSLPKTKVVDFLLSFFKAFNIGVFDTSPNNERLFWLTPNDTNTTGETYSKIELDYTPYVDNKEVTKNTSSDYNYYNFQHAKSKYKSNVDYLTAAGMEYGQITYPTVKPSKTIEYKIQTGFSIVPPINISGSTVKSFYAFNSDKPTFLTTGEARYKPNYGELTIFYSHGTTTLPTSIGVRSTNTAGVIINKPLTQYIKVMPFSKNGKSFSFSILVDDSIDYEDTLFLRYYADQIVRLLDPNVLTHDFNLTLPPDEIYINEATTYQNNGKTPIGFRLQNEIIIGETKYTIIDFEIDITTGKGKAKFLNIK